jgi:hypothetical protein
MRGFISSASCSGNPASQIPTAAFALARYTINGQLDTTFGNSGTVVTAFGAGFTTPSVSASGLTIQADGKIVVVGNYSISVPHRGFDTAIKVIRYLGSLRVRAATISSNNWTSASKNARAEPVGFN